MRELKTALKDRVLRFDGVLEVSPDNVVEYLLQGVPPSLLRATGSHDLENLNDRVQESDQIKPPGDPIKIDMDWNIPPEYKQIDLDEYLAVRFEEKLGSLKYTDAEVQVAIDRISDELQQIKHRGMTRFMQTIVFILDEFKRNNVVWGVGRGSSCACYLLFILGLHVVDCVKMNVPMDEFFHD